MLPGVKCIRSANAKDEICFSGIDIAAVSLTAAKIQQITNIRKKDLRKFLDGMYVSEKGPTLEEWIEYITSREFRFCLSCIVRMIWPVKAYAVKRSMCASFFGVPETRPEFDEITDFTLHSDIYYIVFLLCSTRFRTIGSSVVTSCLLKELHSLYSTAWPNQKSSLENT